MNCEHSCVYSQLETVLHDNSEVKKSSRFTFSSLFPLSSTSRDSREPDTRQGRLFFARHKAGAPILPALLIACRDDVYFGLLGRKTNLTPQMIVCSHQSNSAQHFTEIKKKCLRVKKPSGNVRWLCVTLWLCDIGAYRAHCDTVTWPVYSLFGPSLPCQLVINQTWFPPSNSCSAYMDQAFPGSQSALCL